MLGELTKLVLTHNPAMAADVAATQGVTGQARVFPKRSARGLSRLATRLFGSLVDAHGARTLSPQLDRSNGALRLEITAAVTASTGHWPSCAR